MPPSMQLQPGGICAEELLHLDRPLQEALFQDLLASPQEAQEALLQDLLGLGDDADDPDASDVHRMSGPDGDVEAWARVRKVVLEVLRSDSVDASSVTSKQLRAEVSRRLIGDLYPDNNHILTLTRTILDHSYPSGREER